MTKNDQMRQKLASIIGFFNNEPGAYRWNERKAFAFLARACLTLLDSYEDEYEHTRKVFDCLYHRKEFKKNENS